MSVDKQWSFEQAQEAHMQALKQGADPNSPALPLDQWNALHALDRLERQYRTGDRMALLAAIRKCANHDLVMPEWVARGFIRSYDRVLTCRTGSWDDAFGPPYPKGMHVKRLRNDRQLRPRVALCASQLLTSGVSINDGFFESIAHQLDIKPSLAKRLFYDAQRAGFMPPRQKRAVGPGNSVVHSTIRAWLGGRR